MTMPKHHAMLLTNKMHNIYHNATRTLPTKAHTRPAKPVRTDVAAEVLSPQHDRVSVTPFAAAATWKTEPCSGLPML